VSETPRERVLHTAEQLFTERGYAAVKLRDVAAALGMQQASLYYHAPGGKEELFIAVTERAMQRHQHGLEHAICSAGDDPGAQMQAAAGWLLSQPALNFGRMLRSDMPAISVEAAERLRKQAYRALIVPLDAIFARFVAADDPAARTKIGSLSGGFLALMEGVHNLPAHFHSQPKQELADYWIDVLLHGLLSRTTVGE
jgi:AcrR family transcriptional regulator